MSKNYFLAVATLMGTIIGVGLFTIPYVINKAGIIPLFFYIIVLTFIQYFLHTLFAEIILSTKEKHRLPGFVGKYINAKSKLATFFIDIIGAYGSILAYIIMSGIFLHQLLAPYCGGNVFIYSTVIFIFVSLIAFYDIKLIAGTELILTSFLVIAIGLIAWRGFNYIQLSNYHLIDWKNIFLPYGPIFFAVGGGAAIPEICRLLDRQKDKIKSAIAWGTFLPAVLTLIFVLINLGITGSSTTPDALTGLGFILKNGVITFSLIFGLLAIITSYIVTAQATEEIYSWDLKLNNKLSWFLAGFIPYFLFLIGWSDLIKIISFTGAITGGLSGIILIWLVLKVKSEPEKVSCIKCQLNKPLAYVLSSCFILGVIYEIWMISQ
ncbi:MAG: aromatic amino acid transport family protein [Patescibacteria group bacterium]|nr:aromatic amino acid transport family protein [Patescibacteria group bacterium]